MPELPEVETIVRALTPRIRGRHILSAEILHQRIVRYSKLDVVAGITGQKVENVRRHGKFILIDLSQGLLTIHLGMTGQLLFNTQRTPWTRAIFNLDDTQLLYDDPRMFGSIEFSTAEYRTRSLGPDALSINEDVSTKLRKRRAPIKSLLLNQRIFAGVGNIYADEALFRAGIYPGRRADRISNARTARLIEIIQEVLTEAVDYRGSSVSDYVDTEGRKGSFQNRHNVYSRDGQPCTTCGTPIRKTVIGQRGTHYCPNCQK